MVCIFQHDAGAVICDSELSSKLKSAAYIGLKRMTGAAIEDEIPVLMSGAGHDAMALSHLTKVCFHFPENYESGTMLLFVLISCVQFWPEKL